jgi:hypothetical protein
MSTTATPVEKPAPRPRINAKQKAALQSIEWEGSRTTLTSGAVEVRQTNGDLVWIDRDGNVEKVTEVAAPAQLEVGPRADAAAHDAQTLDAMIRDTGIPRLGAATLAKVYDELDIGDATIVTPTDDQRARMAAYLNGQKSGLIGKEAALWVILGDDGRKAREDRHRLEQQMKRTAAKGASRSRASKRNADAKPEDLRAAELASEAAAAKGKPLSQRVSPKEAATARAVLEQLGRDAIAAGKFPNLGDTPPLMIVPSLLGFTSERAMRAYVDGSKADVADDAKAGVKALTKGIASHQVWARKAAAAAFGVYLQTAKEIKP